jgi:ribonuclease HI
VGGFALFADASANPRLKIGVGAYLVTPCSFLDVPPTAVEEFISLEKIALEKFRNVSSTELEIQTILWALACYRESHDEKLRVYSDSQCVTGLLQRRSTLETKRFLGGRTNRPLKNASLYRAFYELRDELGFEIIKVPGHSPARGRNTAGRIFSFVDKEARKALRLWTRQGGDAASPV